MRRWLAAPLLCGLLTGCSAVKYRRPAVSAPPAFRGLQANAESAASIANAKWFEVFEDTELQALIREALKSNYDLRLAAQRVELARASVGIVRANQFPNVNAGADITTLGLSQRGTFGRLPARQERTFGDVFGALLSFEVDLFGRLRNATAAARASLLATEEARRALTTGLVADVAASYLSLLELDLELDIARRTVAARRESLRLILIRLKGGVATIQEQRQAEQLVYSASQAVPDTERLIEQTENAINLLLGRPPGPITRGRKLTEQILPRDVPAGLPSGLLERRPDIRAAERNLQSAQAQLEVARKVYFPRIALTGTSGFQSDQLSSLFSRSTGVWQFVPQAAQPVFQAGRLGSVVAAARAAEQAALIQYEQAIQTSFREVSDALVQRRRIAEVRTEQAMLVDALQDRSRIAYLRYRGGVDSLLNALDADRDLFNAELGLARTRRNELLAFVQLYRALGGGWD